MALSLPEQLHKLRAQAQAEGAERLGYHQLGAHWSIAYACRVPPEAWEVYRVPSLLGLPSTVFYAEHPNEIQEELRPVAMWELLREHAVPKFELEASMSEEDCKRHAYPGKVQFYDIGKRGWASVDVPSVRWFDGRERTRETLLETKEELQAKAARTLQRYRDAAIKDPTEKRREALTGYEKFTRELLPDRLDGFDREKARERGWLARLDATPDFTKALFTLVREAENRVRSARGVPHIGEAWVSETELLYRVRQLLPGVEVVAHGQPKWLGRQHLDIWIPSFNVAVEYHGVQHYRAVDFFGGEEAFRKGQERDARKRALCQIQGVRLIEVAHDRDMDDGMLFQLLHSSRFKTGRYKS